MAIRVPTYRERQVQQNPVSGQKQNISTPDAAFGSAQADAMVRGGTAVARLGEQWNKKAINIQDENNELRALRLQTDIESEMSTFLYDPNEGLLTKKGANALDAPRMTQTKLNELQARIDNSQEAPEVRSMLQKGMIQIQRRYGDLAKRHQLQEYTSYKQETIESRINLNLQDIAMNYMDDKEFQDKANENFQLLQSRATSEGWSEEKLQGEKLKLYSQARSAQITQMIATDEPQNILVAQKVYEEARARGQVGFEDSLKMEALLEKAVPKAAAMVAYQNGRFGASVTDEAGVINYVIDQMEGGDSIAQEPRGAIAKFGINSEANPDVDVKNLTREGAQQLYKDRYWKPYGIDDVPENMRLLAFDIAVNHRSDFAKKAIEQIKDGAPADKIMNARLKEYQRLATSDPEQYAKYYNGWKDRLTRLSTQMSSNMPVETDVIYAAASQLDTQYQGAGQELIALYDNDRKAREAQEKARKDDVQAQVNQIVSSNNGDWTKVPAVLRSEAASLGIDITAYKGVSDPDVVNELDAMDSNAFASVDLNDPRYAQNLTYDKMQDYVKKQQELAKPENKYLADAVDGIVNYYFRAQGSGSAFDPDSRYNKAKVAAMKGYVSFRAQEMVEQNKRPTKTDLTKFAADYLNQIKKSGITSAADIAEEERSVIEADLLRIGVTPTNEAVMAVYMNTRYGGKQ